MAGWGQHSQRDARRSGRASAAHRRWWTRALAPAAALTVVASIALPAPVAGAASPLDPAAGRTNLARGCGALETRVDRVRHRFALCRDGRFEWKRVVLRYGDSLSSQSGVYAKYYFEQGSDFLVVERNLGGTAPCDWVPKLRRDVSTYAPAAMVYQFSGNYISACMTAEREAMEPTTPGVAPDSEPYYAAYRRDTRTFARVARDRKVALFIASSPPAPDFVDASAGWGRLDDIYREIADEYGARYMAETRLAVAADDGTRVETLPCLSIEPCLGQPVHGHNALFGPDHRHFGCARPVPPPVRGVTSPCPAHSSGALRYGLAMAEVVRTELDRRPFRAPPVPRSLIRR